MRSLLFVVLVAACGQSSSESGPAERWIAPADMKPTGSAATAQHRVLATHPDGTRELVLVLHSGDEVMSALTELAKSEKLENARFSAVGAARAAEVAWFSPQKRQYKGMHYAEQLEVLALTGDVALDKDGAPAVHAHATLGRESGAAVGGHVVSLTAMPTLEVFVTAFVGPLEKRMATETNTQVIDLSL